MADLIPYTTEQILDLFKAAYHEQTGDTLRIGSDEFAFSTVAAYVLRVFEQAIQHGANDSTLETASGAVLDTIGESYGLERSDLGQTARCGLRVTNTTNEMITLAVEDIYWENSETEFFNKYPVEIPANSHVDVVLYCTEIGAKYNGITDITPNPVNGVSFSDISMSYGGRDTPLPYSSENDNIFRAYIKANLKGFGFGTAEYYQAAALKNNDGILTSAYCVRDGDSNFEAGKAKIYCAFALIDEQKTEYVGTVAFRAAVINAVQIAVNSRKSLTDTIEVYSALDGIRIIPLYDVRLLYESRFQALDGDGRSLAESHFLRCRHKYNKTLLETVNKIYKEGDFEKILTMPDEYGVYCSGFTTSTLVAYPRYPGTIIMIGYDWSDNNVQWINDDRSGEL